MNQGGTADSVVLYIFVRDSSLTDSCILSGAFFIFKVPGSEYKPREFSYITRRRISCY